MSSRTHRAVGNDDGVRFLGNAITAQRNKGYKIEVIAAGLPRCATSSVKEAFEILGYDPCIHFDQVAPVVDRVALMQEAILETDKRKRQAILYDLFDGYRATSDLPGAWFVDDLIEMYPDAKVILNTRNPDSWHRSITETIKPFTTKRMRFITYWADHIYRIGLMEAALEQAIEKRLATKSMFNRETIIAHEAWFKAMMEEKGKQYIVFEPSQGWEPLGKFLGKATPNEAFPHANDAAQMLKLQKVYVVVGILNWLKVLSVPTALGAFWIARTGKVNMSIFQTLGSFFGRILNF